uniref:Retrotransposon gag domain-containing protein n=1 Tax=Tanacetum cinerariifolium TaxID=118510 RepID=A0A6L2LMV0_TANCI|nr:hypothetical protein [Tanacetum cinerariifolium]
MKQYMSKTRVDYGSRVARPKIDNKDNFKLKGQFLKELCTNTFSGSDHEDTNEQIEKILEIVDLFHILNITIDQVMLKAFPMSLTGSVSPWQRNEPTGSITTWDGPKTKFLNKYCPHVRTAKKMEEINNFQQEPDENIYQAWERFKELLMKKSMEDTLSKFMSESAKRHEENSKLIKKIRASLDAAVRNQGASIKTLEIQIGKVSKVLQERGFGSLPSSTEANPRDQVKSISTTIEADSLSIRQNKGSYRPQFSKAYFKASQSMPQNEKDPGSFTLPCFINNVCFNNALVDLGASVSVMPLLTYLNLGLGELAHTKLTVELADMTVKYPKGKAENMLVRIGKFVFPIDFIILDMAEDIKVPLILGRPFLSTACAKIDIFKSVKPASSLIKRVYMLSLRERMELHLEARLIEKTLMLNRSLYPFFKDYIELNDLNEPNDLRRNQVDDFMPTIEEGMRDVIVGEPFLREVGIKARRLCNLPNGAITSKV